MKSSLGNLLLVAAAAPLLVGAMYALVPMLASAESGKIADADQRVETARRLLYRYDENEERLAALLAQLQAGGVDVKPDADRLRASVESQRDVVERTDQALRDQSKGPAVSRQRALEERFASFGGQTGVPLVTAGGLGNPEQALRQGLKVRDELLAENAKILKDSLGEVDQAIALTSGDGAAIQHFHAHRLRGVILTAQSKSLAHAADLRRAAAAPLHDELATLAAHAAGLRIERKRVDNSKISDRLGALSQDAGRARQDITRLEAQLAALDAKIAAVKADMEQQSAAARLARESMDALEDRGADLLDPNGFGKFARSYLESSAHHRGAVNSLQTLEFGTLQGVRLDDSGDYLAGALIPVDDSTIPETRRGLMGYLQDREAAALDLQGTRNTLSALEAAIVELEAVASQYHAEVERAASQLQTLGSEAAQRHAEFAKLAEQADESYNQAAQKAREAIAAFRTAGSAAATMVRDSQEVISPLTPEDQEHSAFKKRAEDGWVAGQANNESAQARFLQAHVLYARATAADADRRLVQRVQEAFDLSQLDAAALATRRDTATTDGGAVLRESIEALEKSGRELAGHWTIAAQAGGAHYLLALLENNRDFVRSAIENYVAASQGRDPAREPYVRPILDRLRQLQSH